MCKKIEFTSLDGTRLIGVLEVPQKDIRAKVIMLHGCPSEKDEDGFFSEKPDSCREYKKAGGMAEYLKINGIASFRFDYREHGESESTSDSKNLLISGMINDTESAFHQMNRLLPNVIPTYVIAASFSGGIAINWINIYKRLINRLFLLAPLLRFSDTITKHNITEKINDYEQLKQEYAIELKEKGYLKYGGKKMNKAFINEAMLMNIESTFSTINIPVTIIHGTKDPVISYSVSKEYMMLRNDICEIIPIEGAVHGFGVPNDLEWEDPQTLKNHELVYNKISEKITNDNKKR